MVQENDSYKMFIGIVSYYKGEYIFDDISINKIKIKSLKEHITVIFQDFAQYYFTVKENISFGNIKRSMTITLLERWR